MSKSKENANVTNGDLLDIACELDGAAEAFHDMSILLNTISKGNLSSSQVTSLTRTMQLTCETWANLLDHNKENIEKIVGRTVNGE